ncbi:MAG TPA: hypothetical protein VLG36_04130 [Candidatus Chromulinivoraceae bacterium]|nr:hypothetical protein [Candidatus Chromulinivoraceae bacterium]
MIVHIAGSLRDSEVDTTYLQQIIETVHDHGAVLAHSWLEAAIARQKESIVIPDWTPYVEANLDAVIRADVVIVELTHYSFSQGFLIAAAFEHKKPVLAISRHSTHGDTVSGITNPLFTYKRYSDGTDLKQTVDEFLRKNTVYTQDLRFNMFLTRQIFKYLEEVSHETGKSRSEIIRAIIKRKAEGNRG